MRVDRLIYVFDGAVHEDEPFLAPLINWTRVRFKIGLSPSWQPVLAVAASSALPWWRLGMLS